MARASLALSLIGLAGTAAAAPTVTRLTPPSELFASGNASPPYIARFLPGQRFDLQATVRLDAGTTLKDFAFLIDGVPTRTLAGTTSIVTSGLTLPQDVNAAVVSQRAFSVTRPGVHKLTIRATQSDGQSVSADGSFEVVALGRDGKPAKNIIILLGDGMGAAHRTAARIMGRGYAQGKAQGRLAMDTFPVTGMVMTSSLDGIVTDSSPGMSNYVTGNKSANNAQGVWPDDTTDAFDNPRIEYLAEYLHRTQGKALGIVTTADVFDATPAAMAVHTSNRGYGTGIVDQFLDDRGLTGLTVLMGGGRKWFLPNGDALKADGMREGQPMNGSQRDRRSDYELPADVVTGWGAARGALDPGRDVIGDFERAGFAYAPDKTALASRAPAADKLLGLFAYSNMNVAFDKIGQRRGVSTVVDDYGFPDQPMQGRARGAREAKARVHRDDRRRIDRQAIAPDGHRPLAPRSARVRPRGAGRERLRRQAPRHDRHRHRRPRMLGRRDHRRVDQTHRRAVGRDRETRCRSAARQGRRHLPVIEVSEIQNARRRLSGDHRCRLQIADRLRRQFRSLRDVVVEPHTHA